MRSMRKFLAQPLVTGFIAIAILCLIVWFVGDLLNLGGWRPFQSESTRWIVISVLCGIWVIWFAIWAWLRWRRNRKMVEDIAEEEPDPTAEAVTREQAELQSKFKSAMHELGKRRFKSRLGGTRYLYELPWYIFIGPPGAGKTTALEKSGLDFWRKAGEAITIRDTRNCDWVFSNEAVFIDTAGRYTTQEINRTVDSSSWQKLLDLIARNRPGEPVNGIIVAISISELAMSDTRTIDAHAEAVRERVTEIYDKMRARVPVYLVFTKADLLVGFNEFFLTMRKADWGQVWGMTYPLKGGMDAQERIERDIDRFGDDFDLLVERLGEMQFPRIQEEVDVETRAKIFGFASQFSSLKPVVERFLRRTFRKDIRDEAMLLRGFYFTSATQVGQPVDRLISVMSREFGLERRVVDAMTGDAGRSYFLEGLLRDVVLPEAGLVSIGHAGRKLAIAGRVGVVAACIALPLLMGLGWWTVERHMKHEAAQLSTVLTEYEADLAAIDVTPVEEGHLDLVTPPLNRLRDEAARLRQDEQDAPLWGLGIGDMQTLRDQADLAYELGLEDLMRPRLLYRLEGQMADNLHRPELLYDLLKTYLMIGGRGPMDEDYVTAFLLADWELRYNTELNQDLLEDLSGHLEKMLEGQPNRSLTLDEELIEQARIAVAQISVAERAFRILKTAPETRKLRPWRLTDAGGKTVDDVFVRASGVELSEPVPGLFTYEGFWGLFDQNADDIVEAAFQERWLLTDIAAEEAPSREELTLIRREIRDLYYDEYIDVWTRLLEDLRIVPFRDSEHAADTLNFLSSTRSPFLRVMREMAYHTALAEQPAKDSAVLKEAQKIAFHRFSSKFRNLARLAEAGSGDVKITAARKGVEVQEAFADLHEFVGSDERSGDISQTMDLLEDLYETVDDMKRGQSDLSILSETKPAVRLSRQISRAPRAISRIMTDMLSQADAATVGGVKAQLNEIWRSTIYPACRNRLHNRYPFGGGDEVAFGDLSEILGHGGLIDKFYQQRLASMVDDSVTPWQWKGTIGGSLGIATDRLGFFEQAAKLRDAFFPDGRTQPEIRFAASIFAWHPDVAVARFVLGGSEAVFEAKKESDAPTRYQFVWPGQQPASGAEVLLSLNSASTDLLGNPLPGKDVSVGEPGTWGLFKLIGKSGFDTRGAGDIARVDISAPGGRLFLELRMDSATNPLALRNVIRSFKCPARF